MNRTDALNKIIEAAEKRGFKTGFYSKGYDLWIEPKEGEKYISFIISDRLDADRCDFENHIVACHFEVKASVCRMGGEPTTEELLMAAEQIKQGALLTKELKGIDLAYERNITEG